MIQTRSQFRLSTIAAAVVVAALSVSADAAAFTGLGSPRNCAQSCCVNGVCTVCCCTSARTASPGETTGTLATLAFQGGAPASPHRPCECRAGAPVAPAFGQESDPSEDYTSNYQNVAADSTVQTIIAPNTRLILCTASPPTSPLYLTIARLLI